MNLGKVAGVVGWFGHSSGLLSESVNYDGLVIFRDVARMVQRCLCSRILHKWASADVVTVAFIETEREPVLGYHDKKD